jgi:hypothetical protein
MSASVFVLICGRVKEFCFMQNLDISNSSDSIVGERGAP